MLSQLRTKLILPLLCLAVALPFASCNYSHCESLRDELFAQKLKWQQCESHLDCYKVFGNPGDCTGILSCDLAVNRNYRNEAERRIASLGEDTVDCMKCTKPNCVGGAITLCEPVTKQCVIVTEVLDAGAFASETAPPEPTPMGAGGSP